LESNMRPYRIKHAWYPNTSTLRTIWDRAVKELSESGWGDPQLDFSIWLLWMEDDLSRPIGIVGYAVDRIEKDIWVELTYTAPEHRRKGVYRALFSRLVEMAIRRGVRCIESGIHERNEAMLRAARTSGRCLEPMASEPYLKATLVLEPTRTDTEVGLPDVHEGLRDRRLAGNSNSGSIAESMGRLGGSSRIRG
jgi:GNAT superfamily N-acetyltransferase